MEHQVEAALRPGTFIYDRACVSFVSGLEEVAARIGPLTSSDPARAVALCETFLAGCYEKAEELDDSSGSFAQFVVDLICTWIKARQELGGDPEDTATRLLARMDDDPYGFCYRVDRDAAKVLDKPGLAAFERQVRARFDAAVTTEPSPDNRRRDNPEYLRRRWSEVLRTLYLAQRNITAYVALAEQTGLTPQDCHAVSTLMVARRKPDEALAWVERGIELDRKIPHGSSAGYSLASLQRDLLTKLGRSNEALDAAWADFQKHPDKYTYSDLMKFVPAAQRSVWHNKAMDAARGADLFSVIGLLLDTKEIERLAQMIRAAADRNLEQVSHYALEPAAKKLEKTHPDLAARLWGAQGMRIVDQKKSKYYDAALSNFEHARNCYLRAGLATEWEETVRRVRAGHHRKVGFMAGFEALATGSSRSRQPSFLERAKARWAERQERDDS